MNAAFARNRGMLVPRVKWKWLLRRQCGQRPCITPTEAAKLLRKWGHTEAADAAEA